MPLNITDPADWPPGIAPLRFRPTVDDKRRLLLFTADGAEIATLTHLRSGMGSLRLYGEASQAVPLENAWCLELVDLDSTVIETHVLWETPQPASRQASLTSEVAAWSALMVLRMIEGGEQPIG